MSDSLTKTSNSLIFGERPEEFALGRSFLVSDLSKSLMVAYFWWTTWAIRSHRSLKKGISESLIFLNQKTYIKLFKSKNVYKTCLKNKILAKKNLSDLSDSLTVAHLSWAICANRSQSLIWFEQNEQMSKFPALFYSSIELHSIKNKTTLY